MAGTVAPQLAPVQETLVPPSNVVPEVRSPLVFPKASRPSAVKDCVDPAAMLAVAGLRISRSSAPAPTVTFVVPVTADVALSVATTDLLPAVFSVTLYVLVPDVSVELA